ncbi:4-carboxy-4-hydroxy-2-oxoadipate aldolase/oxaloacetate decarboxylase [Pseudonocardia alaniniphila]|uniref:Putative 4-hydroxy-4-methyl-2-oxoglutarate aldolase n=1 Tax=Pseudonocardia alaniniphila TaxID=75291 RepID=A0ABS9TK38_9PSEU|nr:4-carboxy-4-hydroxy-2-oxoadipate aldolase/oxaloacetate decarboxylase [Pseudonocardia alaniniphila]
MVNRPDAHLVVRSDLAPDADAVAQLGRQGVATVHEAQGRRGLLGPQIRPVQEGAVIAGRAVTVLSHPGDNLMLHAAVEQCRPGDVVVVSTTSESTDGMFGELLAVSMRSRGVIGLVTGAGVRDVSDLRRMGFPVWTRAVSAQGTVKASPGSVNVPVIVGGALVEPGDVVVADDDGVVVVPRAQAPAVAAAGEARLRNEADKRARLAAGELGLDMYGLRAELDRLGVRYVDREEHTDDDRDGVVPEGALHG